MINLQFQYKPLFCIKVSHEYYSERAGGDFAIAPTPRTAQLIDKMAMLCKAAEDKFDVLFDATKLELLAKKLENSNDNELKLSFLLLSKNQYYVNITDTPVDLNGKVAYLSNQHLGAKTNGKLHQKDYVEHVDIKNSAPVELQNENGKDTFRIALENGLESNEISGAEIKPGYQVNAESLIDGHYKIFANDKEFASFVNVASRTKYPPIGYIDIFLNGKLKEKILQGIEDAEIPTFNYSVDFRARSVFWKYIVVPIHMKRLRKLAVNCSKGKEKIEFGSSQEEEIDNKNVITFLSNEPVKFQKQYDYEIQLKKQSDASSKTLVKNMAFAPFDLIKPYNKEDYISEIFIYL